MTPEIQHLLVQHKLSILRNKRTSTMALGVLAKDVRFLSLLCALQGIEAMQKSRSAVSIYTDIRDRGLDENSYVLPEWGDAGDRLYGTL